MLNYSRSLDWDPVMDGVGDEGSNARAVESVLKQLTNIIGIDFESMSVSNGFVSDEETTVSFDIISGRLSGKIIFSPSEGTVSVDFIIPSGTADMKCIDKNKPNDPRYCQNEVGTLIGMITKCKQIHFIVNCERTCKFCVAV